MITMWGLGCFFPQRASKDIYQAKKLFKGEVSTAINRPHQGYHRTRCGIWEGERSLDKCH